MNLIKKYIIFTIIVFFAGCGSGIGPDSGGNASDPAQLIKGGSLEVNIDDAMDVSKLFTPTLMDGTWAEYDMLTAQYEIIITGPRPGHPENTYTRVIDNLDPMSDPGPETFVDLFNGEWNVVVNARNADPVPAGGNIIGSGTAQVVVNPWLIGIDVPEVTVTVSPLPGTGDLMVNVQFNQLVTWDPVLNAYLVSPFGDVTPLISAIDPAQGGVITNMDPMSLLPGADPAFVTIFPLANGYYTLITELREHDDAADPGGLLDEEYLVAGFAEIVRIVTDQVTFGVINWGDGINPHYGDFIVDIDPKMAEPIYLTLSGDTLALVAQGDSMTFDVAIDTASTVPAVTQAVTFFWYENGEFQGTGPSITLTADPLPKLDDGTTAIPDLEQHYRVDVIVYTADGTRAGDTSFSYRVTESMTPNRTITAFDIPGIISSTITTDLVSNTGTIEVVMPYGTDPTALVPTITTDVAKSVTPASGVAQDFSGSVLYTVTPYDPGVTPCVYTVTVTNALNPAKDITQFTINGIDGTIGASEIFLSVPVGTDLSSLTPMTITITGVSVIPASGVAQDFTGPVAYTVTAADSTTKIYIVTVAESPVYNPIAAGQLDPTGCETYISPHTVYPGEILCCSTSTSPNVAPECNPAEDTPDIPCVIEYEFCDDGTAKKAFSPDPVTGMPGHSVSTSGSWGVDPVTGELEIITTSSSMGGNMIQKNTERYPTAFTYDSGDKLDLRSSAAVTIDEFGIGDYHRDAPSLTLVSGLWEATLDAVITTDVTVTAAGYESTFEQIIDCTPVGSMVCTAVPESDVVITSGTHTLPLDLYITPTGDRMFQTDAAKAFVFERQANLCEGIDCGDHGSCDDGVCVCTHGYIGEFCDVAGLCVGVVCGNNSTCVESTGICECAPGYEGVSCEVDINECDPDPCLNGGTCAEGDPGTYVCTCVGGYGGVNCENCPADADGDGYGNPASVDCVHTELDCDDSHATVYPGAPELCDGMDNQCSGDAGYGTIDEGYTVCGEMVSIPSGCFDMGDAFAEGWPDELPVHNVCLSAFEMDRHEITNAEYAECVADGGCTAPGSSESYSRTTYYGDPLYDNFPVIWMQWNQVDEYCTWAGKRLPTEAEWEYAARGGLAGQRYSWGDTTSDADTYANYGMNVGDTTAVESYAANGYGLYDIAGNVWEWVSDWYNESFYTVSPSNDPTGPASGMVHVRRGGSFDHSAFGLRMGNRCDFCHADRHGNNLGGRCARDPVTSLSNVTLTLNSVTDGQIFQRESDNHFDMIIEGTHAGDIIPIEASVVIEGTATVIVDWTTIDSNPEAGVFSGVLYDIPQGGWYQIQVRGQNAGASLTADPNKFGVGVLIACTGQSHIDYWFDSAYGAGAPAANELARMYRHAQILQAGEAWTGWQTVTGMGAAVFANELVEALGVPVGLLDYGVQGASLMQSNAITSMYGWWFDDGSGLHPAADNYAVFTAGLDSIGNRIEAVLWIQGHTDAMQGETTANYELGLDGIFELMRTDAGAPDLPVFTSLVTRQSTTSDVNIQNIRDAEVQKSNEDTRNYIGCTTMDLPLTTDNIHHTPEGQSIQAERLAQAVLHLLLNAGDYTYHRGPQIDGYEIVDGSTIDIQISHTGGTDFTPVSNIKGFNVLGTEVGDITGAVRYDADTIRLTLSGSTSGITDVTYLYGANPDNQDLNSFVTGYVHDNSAMALPLEGAYVQEILP